MARSTSTVAHSRLLAQATELKVHKSVPRAGVSCSGLADALKETVQNVSDG
jgi:hypothetical protein